MLLFFNVLCVVAGMITGGLLCAWADRRFSKIESDPVQPDRVYLIRLLPDPKAVLWKYLLQCLAHVTFTGGRWANVTEFKGQMMLHGFRSTGLYTTRNIEELPAHSKTVDVGECNVRVLTKFRELSGLKWSLLNNCWGVAWQII